MKISIKKTIVMITCGSICSIGLVGLQDTAAGSDRPQIFDHDGSTIFNRYSETSTTYMSAGSGDRNLVSYYDRRQYPGSPPFIPHSVETPFSNEPPDCLSCHDQGGFSPEHNKFIPVTPHPDKEACYQCHVPVRTTDLFKESEWLSIDPPALGRSALGGSPPPVPHSLQMREDCIACHTGPGSVVEIRVEHSARGNCRQCHVPVIRTEPLLIFQRNQ